MSDPIKDARGRTRLEFATEMMEKHFDLARTAVFNVSITIDKQTGLWKLEATQIVEITDEGAKFLANPSGYIGGL